METQNETEIINLLYQLALCFDYKLQPDRAKLYVELLCDVEMSELRQNVNDYLRYGKSFPLPWELRRSALEALRSSSHLSLETEREMSNFAP